MKKKKKKDKSGCKSVVEEIEQWLLVVFVSSFSDFMFPSCHSFASTSLTRCNGLMYSCQVTSIILIKIAKESF